MNKRKGTHQVAGCLKLVNGKTQSGEMRENKIPLSIPPHLKRRDLTVGLTVEDAILTN